MTGKWGGNGRRVREHMRPTGPTESRTYWGLWGLAGALWVPPGSHFCIPKAILVIKVLFNLILNKPNTERLRNLPKLAQPV